MMVKNMKITNNTRLSALNRICKANSIMCDCGLIILFVYK